MKISSYSALKAEVIKRMSASLVDVGDDAKEIVKKRIDSDVYGAGSPSEYIRTQAFRESQTCTVKSVGNPAVVEIKSDGGGGHYSVVDGSSVGNMDKIIHDGRAGRIFGSGFWTSSRPYMDNAKQELRSGKFKALMVKALRSNGLRVK